MNKIKESFLIQDLELLSGVKAHTIRIWEKRYDLLNPVRLNRNIRKYDLEDLQKLLNVSVLYSEGYKISKVAKLSEEELFQEARNVGLKSVVDGFHLKSLVMAMYAFDKKSFEKIYTVLINEIGFEKLFIEIYIPLLKYIGVLWQTNAIRPAHEHFISSLIIEKIVLNTSLVKQKNVNEDKIYILFLPEEEMHGIGLLFLNYCLKVRNQNTLYLGGSIPLSDLEVLNEKFESIHWVCSFVIDKTDEKKNAFIGGLSRFLEGSENQCSIIGSVWSGFEMDEASKSKINFYSGFKDFPMP